MATGTIMEENTPGTRVDNAQTPALTFVEIIVTRPKHEGQIKMIFGIKIYKNSHAVLGESSLSLMGPNKALPTSSSLS